ncbi:hypothetical protein CEXT_492671 [Caerostris extrusa]|uniref:Uncharacterized protein n=1 Tax=Caerostris extrusa TaxID=172846 RepID=A0AAV4PAA3_CAEEX|nr:hypothetical protein CEXT_492671 [Caerostris extrusa]
MSVSWTRVLLRINPGVRTCVMEVALLGARFSFMLNASCVFGFDRGSLAFATYYGVCGIRHWNGLFSFVV